MKKLMSARLVANPKVGSPPLQRGLGGRKNLVTLSRICISVEFRVREGYSCFSFVPIASAAMSTFLRSRWTREPVRSSAPSVSPARKVRSLGGVPTVVVSWLRGLGGQPRSLQSILPQPSASSSPRGAEGMRHSRCKYEHPLRKGSLVSPMAPNRALNRTLNQRRYACWFRAG